MSEQLTFEIDRENWDVIDATIDNASQNSLDAGDTDRADLLLAIREQGWASGSERAVVPISLSASTWEDIAALLAQDAAIYRQFVAEDGASTEFADSARLSEEALAVVRRALDSL
jgi:hypothetical protein